MRCSFLFRKLQGWIITEREEVKVNVINRDMEMPLSRWYRPVCCIGAYWLISEWSNIQDVL